MKAVETILNISIGITIMILLPLTVHVGTRLVVKEPSWSMMSGLKYGSSEYQEKQKEYDVLKKEFDKHHFWATTIVGLAALIAGVLVIPVPFVAMGFVLGGAVCLAKGYLFYWNQISDIFKFISLILALLVLTLGSFRMVRAVKK